VARVSLPSPNLVFDHRAHAARNIGCGQCHGDVERVGLATRAQLPRMRGCLRCHTSDEATPAGEAKSACDTCHVRALGNEAGGQAGRIRTRFASGVLMPPAWLHDAAHDPDFLERHKRIAGADSSFCGSCHREEFCADCHDGRVRPRGVHPSDYLNMHAAEARLATSRCTSCHREQSFCVQCHQRLGIAMTGPDATQSAFRFHPPKQTWSDLPVGPAHHAVQARRNLESCVSCHVERDCVGCHAARGIGAGYDPHGPGFAGQCAGAFHRNPRPCLVCHGEGDPVLQTCR
jgi:hypothetical protein